VPMLARAKRVGVSVVRARERVCTVCLRASTRVRFTCCEVLGRGVGRSMQQASRRVASRRVASRRVVRRSGERCDTVRSASGGDKTRSARGGDTTRSARGGDAARSARGGDAVRSARGGDAARSARGGDAVRSARGGDTARTARTSVSDGSIFSNRSTVGWKSEASCPKNLTIFL
jgi:hypothetical protein